MAETENTLPESGTRVSNLIATIRSWRDLADGSTPFVLAFSAALYVLGLLVVNMQLAQYGVPPASLFSPNFILVGAMFVVICAAGYLFPILLLDDIRISVSWWRLGKGSRAIYSSIILTTTLLLSYQIIIASVTNGELAIWSPKAWLGIAYVWGYVNFSILLAAGVGSGNLAVSASRGVKIATLEAILKGLSALAWIILTASIYTRTLYPELTASLGGGKTKPVRMLPSEDSKIELAALGLSPDPVDGLIGPLMLITESDTELLVRYSPVGDAANSLVTVRITRDMIRAIVAVDKSTSSRR